MGKMYGMHDGAVALGDRGFWLADGDFSTRDEAFEAARAVVRRRCSADGVGPLPVIGDFVIPPVDGVASRDFQTLHFDFGLPLVPAVAQDVARYTALYVARSGSAGPRPELRLVWAGLSGPRCGRMSFTRRRPGPGNRGIGGQCGRVGRRWS